MTRLKSLLVKCGVEGGLRSDAAFERIQVRPPDLVTGAVLLTLQPARGGSL